MIEVWKDIENYEGLYQISNLGRIKSLPREYITANGGVRNHGEMIMKPFKCGYQSKKYLSIELRKNNKGKHFRIHRLVAITFISNPEDKDQVNHIDGDKSNNCISNLEWCDNRENCIHAVKNGLRIAAKGEMCGMSKITNDIAIKIYKDAKSGRYIDKEIAIKYNISREAISGIKHGRNWSWLTKNIAI